MRTPSKSLLLVALVALDLLLAAAPFASNGISRRSSTRAWQDWKRNPSPQTEAIWKAESQRLRWDNSLVDLVFLLLFIVNTAGIVKLMKKDWPGKSDPK